MSPLRLSVALCTYNGGAYLPAQLQSIATQQRVPDELVVCDDRSGDGTLEILRSFAATAPFPVRIEINARNLGSTANFAKAISLCTGDLIALADQDDIWHPDKLAKLEAALRENPRWGAVFSDAAVVADDLTPLGYRLWESIQFKDWEKRCFRDRRPRQVLMRRNVVTGATMMFRAELKANFLPIPPDWVHDAWIALMISASAGIGFIEEPLIDYRQHGAQQIGAKPPDRHTLFARLKKLCGYLVLRLQPRHYRAATHRTLLRCLENAEAILDRLTSIRHRLEEQAEGEMAGEIQDLRNDIAGLHDEIGHLRFRLSLPQALAARASCIQAEVGRGRYGRYANGVISAVRDCILPPQAAEGQSGDRAK